MTANQLPKLTNAQRRAMMGNPISCLRTRRAYEMLFDEQIPAPGCYQTAFEKIALHFGSFVKAWEYCLTMSNNPSENVTPFERKEK